MESLRLGVPQCSILTTILFPTIHWWLSLWCYKNAIYADDTTFCCKWDQTSDLWYLLEVASEYDPVDWSINQLVDYNTGKTQFVIFDLLNNCGATNAKLNGCNLQRRSSFKILGLSFSFKLIWCSNSVSIAKSDYKKIGALICSIHSFSSKFTLYLYQSIIHPSIEYCCQICAGVSNCYLHISDKQRGTAALTFTTFLNSLTHCQNVACLKIIKIL